MDEALPARLVRRFYAEVWNLWSDTAAEEVLAPDLEFRGSFDSVREGRAGFLAYRAEVRDAFPDFVCELQGVISEPDRAAARLRFHGTHRGSFWGVAPSGRRIDYAGAAFFDLTAGGQIGRIWVLGDLVAVRQQLGLDARRSR
jgi:steroid delta-isomerase-like uncharacterized protein